MTKDEAEQLEIETDRLFEAVAVAAIAALKFTAATGIHIPLYVGDVRIGLVNIVVDSPIDNTIN